MKINKNFSNSNQYELLKKLTIVIPSFNRQLYILRQISFWSKYKNIKIIILDGSKKTLKKDLLKNINKNILYYHLPISLEKRFEFVINKLSTDYSVLLSDDEFYLPSALESCIRVMDNDPNTVCCKGQTILFEYYK